MRKGKKVGNKNKYSEDAFFFMLQGLIYEKSNDINNAFIACHTAADVYLDNKGSHYRTKMPDQLKKDLICIAYLNGFIDELDRYEKLLNTILVKAVIRPKPATYIYYVCPETFTKRNKYHFASINRELCKIY